MLPTMCFGDAVSNDAAAIRQMIREMGYETEIYADNIDERLPDGYVKPTRELPEMTEEDLLIYHGSTGDPMNLLIPRLGGRKIMRYHNITPPEFFREYSAKAAERTAGGYREMELIAWAFPYGISDSDFNRQGMRKLGFRCPIDVCPIVIPFEDYEKEPDAEVLQKYQGDGYVNLLFVGRIAPNKRQENVIRAFAEYHREYETKSRLFLVGSAKGMEGYLARLQQYVKTLGLEESVVFPGQISFRAILAYYRIADVFVCMSEHEGFCVPIVEAMYFDKPIVALRAAAVPETLGRAGLVLEDNDPMIAAAAVNRIVKDKDLQRLLKKERRKQLEKYTYEVVSKRMSGCIEKFANGKV
jgi:glycosyltransferase involved in cell wall biosynthesis